MNFFSIMIQEDHLFSDNIKKSENNLLEDSKLSNPEIRYNSDFPLEGKKTLFTKRKIICCNRNSSEGRKY
jgi:hypothetical protein